MINSTKYMACFVLLLLLAFGLFVGWLAVCSAVDGWRSKSWPHTTGTIITSALVDDGSGQAGLHILYQYTVGTNVYESMRVAYGVNNDTYMEKYERCLRYIEGGPVSVCYNPKDPTTAVLEPGVRGCRLLCFLTGLLAFLGYLIWWLSFRMSKQYTFLIINKRRIIQLILFLTLGSLCVILSVVSVRFTIYGLASRTWPIAEGIIVDSRLISNRDSSNDTMTTCNVIYQYQVGSNEYRSERIYFGGFDMDDKEYYKHQKYKNGVPVRVYYNPSDPSMAVLEPGVHRWKNMVILLVFSYGGLGFVFWIGKVLNLGDFQF